MSIEITQILILIVGVLIGLFFGVLIGKIVKYKVLKNERALSVKKSRSVILGEVYEKVLPFLPNFPYSPKDMTFVGKGIDYIIFDGLSEGDLRKIVFLEVKSGTSKLNGNERMIRDIILQNKVEYKEYKI